VLEVAVVSGAAWLLLFVVLLIVPPSSGSQRGGGPDDGMTGGRLRGLDGDEPPAVVSLLAGKLDRTGFGATLAGLAARGWFQVRPPGGPGTFGGTGPGPGGSSGPGLGGSSGPGQGGALAGVPGPHMCVVSAETPGGELAPFERRVLAHVARRAGAAGQVPAPALADGFEGGEDAFMAEFKKEVAAEARRRGLIRARLSGRRIGLLYLLLAGPAGVTAAAVAAAHRPYGLAWAGGVWFAGFLIASGVGGSRRRSAAGQAALERWRAAVAAAPADGRLIGYAAALGTAPAALAVFAHGAGYHGAGYATAGHNGAGQAVGATAGGGGPVVSGKASGGKASRRKANAKNVAWSSYRGGWQQLEIETSTWSWGGCLTGFGVIVAAVLYVLAAIWLGTHGLAVLAETMVALVVIGGAVGGVAWLVRRPSGPQVAEFDGQVIRQWMVKGDDDSPDEFHVAVDDGARDKAWDFSIGAEPWRRLTPGTFVHVRVNMRKREDLTVAAVEPPAVAGPLAGVAADQQRAATRGLPDPEELVTRDEAAFIIGGPVDGKHADAGQGRTMIWQHARTTRPMLRVEVRDLSGARPVPPGAWLFPGVADGWQTEQAAGLTVPPLITQLSLHGTVPYGTERLAGLLPVVEGRLRDQVTRLSREAR